MLLAMPTMFRFCINVVKPLSLVCIGVMLSWGQSLAVEQLAANTVRRPAEARQDVQVADDLVVVKGFSFTGNTGIGSSELQGLLAGYVDQTCGLERLRQAADKVTAEYQRRGFTLAKAYIPQQQIESGIITISVVEGRIGQIVIEGNTNYSSNFIRRYINGGDPDRQLTIEQLERGLLLLNSKFTDLKVSANIEPGKEQGTADVQIKVEDRAPLHLTLSSNNYGSKYVSRFRFGAQGEWVNAVIPGAKLTASTMIGEQPENMKVISGSYEFPVNSVGTTIGVSAFDGNFDMGKDFEELGIHNQETSGEFFISQPLIKRRLSSLSAKLGFRVADTRYYYLDELSGKDKTRAVFAQLLGDQFNWGGRSYFSLLCSQGLGTSFGGSDANEVLPPSRQNSSNAFTRINFDLGRFQPISEVFSTILRISAQWSDSALMAGEEWLIGGVNSVHGYTSGEASGDRGYMTSLSVTAAPLEKKGLLQISTYLDHGFAYKKYYSIGSTQTHELTGIGLGVASHFDTVASTDVRLDIGIPLTSSTNYQSEKPVIYLETAFRF